jgi:putative peptidoglycan lipid II flippase
MALAVGAVIGAALQALTQAFALLRSHPRIRLTLRLTPDTRRILRLYGPVALGLLVSMAGQVLDIAFKANQGESVIAAMYFATTLTQFPIGIAVAALSFAILPSISSDAAFERVDRFKDTLAQGIRLVLFLTIPAAVGYIALATPIVSLLFQHGHYRHHGTAEAATALIGYAIQIPFVGLDQMLIFAFYARKDTRTPMLIGVLGVAVYVVAALLLGPRFHILGLALANTLQNSLHAIILLALLITSIGWLRDRGIIGSVLRSLVAGLVMGVVAASAAAFIGARVNAPGISGQILTALPPLIVGGALYLTASGLLRSPELTLAWQIARHRRVRAVTDS